MGIAFGLLAIRREYPGQALTFDPEWVSLTNDHTRR